MSYSKSKDSQDKKDDDDDIESQKNVESKTVDEKSDEKDKGEVSPKEEDNKQSSRDTNKTDDENSDSEDGAGDGTCPICLNEYDDGDKVMTGTKCNHMFHYDCCMQWVEKGNDHCPYCREDMMTAVELLEAAKEVIGEERIEKMIRINEDAARRLAAMRDLERAMQGQDLEAQPTAEQATNDTTTVADADTRTASEEPADASNNNENTAETEDAEEDDRSVPVTASLSDSVANVDPAETTSADGESNLGTPSDSDVPVEEPTLTVEEEKPLASEEFSTPESKISEQTENDESTAEDTTPDEEVSGDTSGGDSASQSEEGTKDEPPTAPDKISNEVDNETADGSTSQGGEGDNDTAEAPADDTSVSELGKRRTTEKDETVADEPAVPEKEDFPDVVVDKESGEEKALKENEEKTQASTDTV